MLCEHWRAVCSQGHHRRHLFIDLGVEGGVNSRRAGGEAWQDPQKRVHGVCSFLSRETEPPGMGEAHPKPRAPPLPGLT